MRLNKKTALVTGAARGIGAAIAEAFVREGAVVWLSDILENEGVVATARLGDHARFIRLDVRDEEDWKNAVDKLVDRDGRLDILVNNAGVTGFETGCIERASGLSVGLAVRGGCQVRGEPSSAPLFNCQSANTSVFLNTRISGPAGNW